MHLPDYVRALRRQRTILLGCVIAGLVIAWLITLFSPRVFLATASGIVRMPATSDPAKASAAETVARSKAGSYVDLATGRDVAEQVIEELQLDTAPDRIVTLITVTHQANTPTLRISARAATAHGARVLADTWVNALATQVQSIEDPRKTGKTVRLQPVEAATSPLQPISPNPGRNLLAGASLGLLVGAAAALSRARLDRRIRDTDALPRQFGVAVLGAIPRSSALVHSGTRPMPVMSARTPDAATSAAAEAFFALRTNVSFTNIKPAPRVIVVTSPLPGDGKSTIAANLAAAMSEGEDSVILIDGDLRRSVLAHSFELSGEVGLTELLRREATFNQVAQHPNSAPRLTVIPAGGLTSDPSKLLGSQAMRQLLQALRRDHLVVIDAPPLLPVTDAAVLAAIADGALVVISAGKTLDVQLNAALTQLKRVDGRVLGIIANRVEVPRTLYSSYARDYRRAVPAGAERGSAGKPVKGESIRSGPQVAVHPEDPRRR